MTIPIRATFTLSQFPTIDNGSVQRGSLVVARDGDPNVVPNEWVTAAVFDWVNDRCTTDSFYFGGKGYDGAGYTTFAARLTLEK